MRATTVLVKGRATAWRSRALARRVGHDLDALAVTVVSMGGSTSIVHFLERYGPRGFDHRLLGLCDQAEQAYVRRALDRAGLGAEVAVHVCRVDLEDELIR